MFPRLRLIAPIAAVAMLSVAAAFAPPPRGTAAEAAAPARAVTVKIASFAFGPAAVTVPAGTQVTWLNDDDDAHDIVADDRSFRSQPLDTGDSYAFTFSKPGTYGYHCGLHPHMVGKVVVTP